MEKVKPHVVIEKDEAGYYVGEVPGFPGCFSQGRSRDEALGNIKEAIAGWLEAVESTE